MTIKNTNIEVEGGEILIQSKEGHYAVIPSKHRREVMDMVKDNCDGCINSYIQGLPKEADYAEDGSLYSEYLTTDPPAKKHPLDPNLDGSLPSYFKGSDKNPIELDEVTVTAEAPEWVKYKNEYVKSNPFKIDEYVENRYNAPVGREAIKKIDGESWKKELRQEGLEKRYNSAMDYTGEQLVKNKPQGNLSRAEWLNQMNDKEEELIKRNPKYQSTLWNDTKRGLTSLVEQNPAQTFQNILSSSDYSTREKREMLKDYVDHPVMSKLGDLAKILSPVTALSKVVQSTYRDDTTFVGALKGEKNNASLGEDMLTDLTNLSGMGIGRSILKGGLKGLTKVGGKTLATKVDDIAKPLASSVDDVFKPNSDAYYRMIGDKGYEDAIQSGVLRSPKNSHYSVTSYSKGKPWDDRFPGDYMVEAKNSEHFKADFPGEVSSKYDIPINSPDLTFYKKNAKGEFKKVTNTTSSVDEVGNVFKGLKTGKEKEMLKWWEDKLKFDKLPKTTNKESLGVLDDFKTRIQTPEGKRRMKELGIDSDEMLQKLDIVEDPNTFGYFTGDKNKIVLNPNHPLPRKVARHEIEHGVQHAKKTGDVNKAGGTDFIKDPKILKANTEIDDLLSGLELRREGTPNKEWSGSVIDDKPVNIDEYKSAVLNKQNATDYFLTGSQGREKSAFLGEVQQYMMDAGTIPKKGYVEITPEMVKNTMVDAMFDEDKGGKFLRLFNIMKASDANYNLVAKGLNKMLGITPAAIGTGAALQNNKTKTEE